MLNNLRRVSWPLLILILTAGIASAVAAPRGEETPQRRKARHYFLTAAKYEAEGKGAEGHELYRKAYETDTTYAEAAFEYGIRRLIMPSGGNLYGSDESKNDAMRMARKYVDKYPGDFFPGYVYVKNMENSEELDEAVRVSELLRRHNPGNSDILQLLTSLYLDTGEFDKAIETWDAYGKLEGEDLEYFVRKAGMKVATKDTVGSLEEGRKMVEKNPGNPAAVAFLARLYDFYEHPDSALYYFQKAESMSPTESGGMVKMQLADFYLNQGDSINYDAKTYEALMADDLDFATKKDVLAYYLQNIIDDDGDRARGDKLFAVLLAQYPHEPELLSLAARYSASKMDFKKASEEIDYAIDLDRNEPKYWQQAMTYCLLNDEFERGYNYFLGAKEQFGVVSTTAYSLGAALAMMNNQPEVALEVYGDELEKYFPGQKLGQPMNMDALRKSLTADGVDLLADLYQQIGDAYYKIDKTDQAYEAYDNSLMLNPNSALTLNNYAYFLVKEGDTIPEEILNKADEMSKRAIVLSPDNPTYLDTRAWVLFRKGEYKEAKEIQLNAIELVGENASEEEHAEFWEHMGDILFMNHEPDEALEYWKKALKSDSDNELLRRKVKHKTFFFK